MAPLMKRQCGNERCDQIGQGLQHFGSKEHVVIEAETQGRYNRKTTMKAITKLAQDGGRPIRQSPLPYSRQVVDESDIKAVEKALRGDLITRGPVVEAFEQAVADFSGMPYAIAFSSATAALHAVMAMYKVKAKSKVVTTPITFAATANAVRYCDGDVVFSDVERSTMNLSVESLSKIDLTDVSVVAAVDFSGNPCRYNELKELQKKHSFALIDDASHSLGGSYAGKPIGSQADLSVFSFHPVKSITTGEGGIAVVRDKAQAEFLRRFRAHGIIRGNVPGYYEQEFLGYNYNITDIQCALGLSQLKRLPRFVDRRNEIAAAYLDRLKAFPALELPSVTPGSRSSWHLFALRVHFDQLKVGREDFLRALHAENIMANVHYIPVYFHPYYRQLGYKKGLCPVAEDSYAREVSIPVFPAMSDADIDDVVAALEKLLNAFQR